MINVNYRKINKIQLEIEPTEAKTVLAMQYILG
jgi:hypothetical protein